jgi:hypothetical protein
VIGVLRSACPLPTIFAIKGGVRRDNGEYKNITTDSA